MWMWICRSCFQGQRCAERRQDKLRRVRLVPHIWGGQEKSHQVETAVWFSAKYAASQPDVSVTLCICHLTLQYRVLVPLHGHRWRRCSVHVRVGVFLRGAVWEDGADGHRTSALPGFALPDARPGQTWEPRFFFDFSFFIRQAHPATTLFYHLNFTYASVCFLLFIAVDRTLGVLKRTRRARLFFDTFFNLEKYLDHEQRDPFAVQKVWIHISCNRCQLCKRCWIKIHA